MLVVQGVVQGLLYSAPFAFCASHRLASKDGFQRVIRAESVLDQHFKVFFARNSKAHARLGIVASKRVIPGAVQRNRIKRVVRELFRRHVIKASQLDLVVMVRSVHACHGPEQIQSLDMLLNRIYSRCAKL